MDGPGQCTFVWNLVADQPPIVGPFLHLSVAAVVGVLVLATSRLRASLGGHASTAVDGRVVLGHVAANLGSVAQQIQPCPGRPIPISTSTAAGIGGRTRSSLYHFFSAPGALVHSISCLAAAPSLAFGVHFRLCFCLCLCHSGLQ